MSSLAKSSTAAGPSPRFYTLITCVIVVAVLRLTEEVTIPVALAFLLAFLLSPVVVRLMRWKFPKPIAIVLTAVLAFSAIATVAWQIASQAVALLDELPRYETNLHQKIEKLKKPQTSSTFSQGVVMLEKMWSDLQAPSPDAPLTNVAPVKDKDGKPLPVPVPVEVHTVNRSSFEMVRDIVLGLFKPLSTAGIVAIFVIAILFQREDLRSRLIRVISGGHLNIAIEAVEDAAQRVTRYLFAQLMVNTCFGLAIGLGLSLIGIPHAPLWGLLATLLRFIPFLGPLIAVVFPLVLAVAVDPGWSMMVWTLVLFVVAEIITNNLVEVLVYGASTGVSTLALLVGAVFWTWLWGIAGLFLSTPMTVCLLVLSQYVPNLKFLGVLLGSEPPLKPDAQFYQHMLSMDQEEVFNFAEAFVKERTITEFYDDVFVPALLMAEVDRHNGLLAEVRQKFIFQTSRELIEELAQPTNDDAVKGSVAPFGPPVPVFKLAEAPDVAALVLPARDEADELVALMLAHLLRLDGVTAAVTSATDGTEESRAELQSSHRLIFISALPPSTLSAAARATRRVKHINPNARVLVGVWSTEAKIDKLRHRLDTTGAETVVTRLGEAVVLLKKAAAGEPAVLPTARTDGQTVGEEEKSSVAAPGAKPEDTIDATVREVAKDFNVPISLVSVLQTDRGFWKPVATDTNPPFGTTEKTTAIDEVLVTEKQLVIEDLSKDERPIAHSSLIKRGVKFLATTPLRTRAGHCVGHLCVLDTQPRKLDAAQRDRLTAHAAHLMTGVEAPSVEVAQAVPITD